MQKPKLKTWKKGLLIFFLFPLLFYNLNSCNPAEPEPPPPKPPGYQEDIPWPSLADSPWPMYRCDPQNTGRSDYVGPAMGEIQWIDSLGYMRGTFTSSPILVNDTLLVVGTSNDPDSVILGFNPNNGVNNLIFRFEDDSVGLFNSNWVETAPLIDKNSNIYFGLSNSHNLLAANSNGIIKWATEDLGYIITGINIDKKGNILLVGDNTLYSISNAGSINYQLTNQGFKTGEENSIAVSPNGKHVYIPGLDKTIYAVNLESREIEWSFGNSRYFWGPVVGSNGDIFVISKDDSNNTKLYSLNSSGSINWEFGENLYWEPKQYPKLTLDKLGNIYFGTHSYIYSVNYKGVFRWRKLFDINDFINSPLVSDRDGNIFVIINRENNSKVVSYDSLGNKRWSTELNILMSSAYSPMITKYNQLILSSYRQKYLIAIK